MTAVPVGVPSATSRTPATSIPSRASAAFISRPNESAPTAPNMVHLTEPSDGARRTAATAWFAPFPPAAVVKDVDAIVSPGIGIRRVVVIRSVFSEPIVVIVFGIVEVCEGRRSGGVVGRVGWMEGAARRCGAPPGVVHQVSLESLPAGRWASFLEAPSAINCRPANWFGMCMHLVASLATGVCYNTVILDGLLAHLCCLPSSTSSITQVNASNTDQGHFRCLEMVLVSPTYVSLMQNQASSPNPVHE